MSVERLSSLDRSTLRERALDSLRAAITAGQYRPGDHLGEVEIAGHLGISRGTVREALRHLQQEGLVVAGNRGMLRVRSVTPTEVEELFRVRAALEGLAAAEIIAAPNREAATRDLRAAARRLADDKADFAAHVEADVDFHLLLCRLSGNSVLLEAWRQLEGRLRVTIVNMAPPDLPSMMSADRHLPIIEAIEQGDVAAAKAVVEAHMAAAAEQYLRYRQDG